MVFTSSEPAGVLYMMCAGTKLCCPDTRGLRTTAWVTLVPEDHSKTSLLHTSAGVSSSGYSRKY